MKIALVKPPITGHGTRGVGFYGQRLYESLKKITNVSWIDFSFLPQSDFDIIHYPYFDFFWPTLSPIHGIKTIVTVHDVIPLKFPEHYPMGLRAKIVWPWQKLLLKHVDAVLTDSFCSQKDIKQIIGVNNVFVTYLAADPIFKPLNLKLLNSVLYVGGANWNKNVITLVKACQKIGTPLVLVGKDFVSKPGENFENKPLIEILKQVQDDKLITIKGFVETGELVKLYNQAKVYVQPSIYEGFGLPVLEAMACGTPVICGKNSSLGEIVGDAATFCDTTDISKLVSCIESVKVTGKEIKQSEKFNWDKTAKETYEVYQKVLAA